MLKRLVDTLWKTCQKEKFQCFTPIADAVDTFCYEPLHITTSPPFIRDAVDIKRWMILVVFALSPAIFFAIWNSGLQSLIYSSGDPRLMETFLQISNFQSYLSFAFCDIKALPILWEGCKIFFPLLLISYGVGGLCEVIFAVVRKHKIAEGLLVTGILYPLTLPPTIPYWMAALGIAFGVVISKELFGGTGMNILNPALSARVFLFFTFPEKMSGDTWVGSNPTVIKESLLKMNASLGKTSIDGFSQSTCLQTLNSTLPDVKRIHADAIATNILHIPDIACQDALNAQFSLWAETHPGKVLSNLTLPQLQEFVTSPLHEGGLGLLPTQFDSAYAISDVIYGIGKFSTANLFWGNILGSLGETSTFACLLGALFLIVTGIASWRTMVGIGLGAFITAWAFKVISILIVGNHGAWAPARFFIPAYKHLCLGGLAFGMIFMATDPVTSPTMKLSKWIYGLFIGFMTIVIRLINPAYPEGMMLAILLGNVFAPFLDHLTLRKFRKRRV